MSRNPAINANKRTLRRLAALLCVAFAATLVATFSFAAEQDEAQRKQYWQKRYTMVLNRSAVAESRLAAAERAMRKARQRDRLKGQARIDINLELEAATQEANTARTLLAEFPEAARLAGVSPGWLREVEDRPAANDPSATDAAVDSTR